jgi:hypothetical protein
MEPSTQNILDILEFLHVRIFYFQFAIKVVFYKLICKVIFKLIITRTALTKQRVNIRIVTVPCYVRHRLRNNWHTEVL